ncbi:hypothetical protein CSC73_00780 [Pseudoxanthomonas sacheonensis]|nr:hypothetical protein CSC73_00780 [Pseudoxanthomonas sacheonensis]
MSQTGPGKQKSELNLEKNAFADQSARIIEQLADGETYSEISAENRAKVRDALNRIDSQLQAAGGVEGLTAQQKAEVFNDQELINTLLTKAGEDSRLVCSREKKVGSHRQTTQCMTVAERKRAHEDAQSAIRNIRVPTLEAR